MGWQASAAEDHWKPIVPLRLGPRKAEMPELPALPAVKPDGA
jgi:hypothetical protein